MNKVIYVIIPLIILSLIGFFIIYNNNDSKDPIFIKNDIYLTTNGELTVQVFSRSNDELIRTEKLPAKTEIKLEGPYADNGGGYSIQTKDNKYTFDNKDEQYIINSKGLSQSGNKLLIVKTKTQINKDEGVFNKYAKTWVQSLTAQEKDAISYYTANYGKINNYLRGIESSTDQLTLARIQQIDQAIDKFQSPKSTLIYRGVSLEGFKAGLQGDMKVGNSYIDKGYMSSTFDLEVAKNFGSGVILYINIPKSVKGAYINDVSVWDNEKEFLIRHNSKFKITKIKDNGKLKLVYLDYQSTK